MKKSRLSQKFNILFGVVIVVFNFPFLGFLEKQLSTMQTVVCLFFVWFCTIISLFYLSRKNK